LQNANELLSDGYSRACNIFEERNCLSFVPFALFGCFVGIGRCAKRTRQNQIEVRIVERNTQKLLKGRTHARIVGHAAGEGNAWFNA